MKRLLTHCLCLIFLGLAPGLTGCLPGEKQSEAVIQKATQVSQEVQAEKVVSDMTNAALTLLGGSVPSTATNELQTFACPNEDKSKPARVIAYIPRTSKLAPNGTVPPILGTRMVEQLKSNFGPKAAGTAQEMSAVLAGCAMSVDMVASNGPVLMVESFADQQVAKPDENLVQVQVRSCENVNGQKVPGIVVTKTMKDGTTQAERHCGKAISKTDKLDLGIATALMPNWKKRLAGDINASEPFKCIVRHKDNQENPCVELSTVKDGETLKCTEKKDVQGYVVNPVYTPKAEKFTSGADIQCGWGWEGQMVARIKSKSCTIMRDGKQIEPATIHEVSYVAGKCSRANIDNLQTQCPVGSDFRDGTFYMGYGKATMKNPLAYETTEDSSGIMRSRIAGGDYKKRAGSEVIDKDVEGVKTAISVRNVFFPEDDSLRGYNDRNHFAGALIRAMGKDNIELSGTRCNISGNSCIGSASPDHIVVIMDRSASMGSPEERVTINSNMKKAYQCKAGLKNLFRSGVATEACGLVKQFHQMYQGPAPHTVHDEIRKSLLRFMREPWAGNPPGTEVLDVYDRLEKSLQNSERYAPYLQFALANGWNCSGGPNGEDFPLDMFGTCTGEQSCNTCPGECQLNPISSLAGVNVRRIDAATLLVDKLSRMRIKPGAKITMGAFVNDTPSVKTTTFCPESERGNGFCDTTKERQNVVGTLLRRETKDSYVRSITQQIILPTEKFKRIKVAESGPGEWETYAEAKAAGTVDDDANKYDFGQCMEYSDCGEQETQCEYVGGMNASSAYDTPECRGARDCQARRAEIPNLQKNAWFRGWNSTGGFMGAGGYDTYCEQRRLKNAAGKETKICLLPDEPAPRSPEPETIWVYEKWMNVQTARDEGVFQDSFVDRQYYDFRAPQLNNADQEKSVSFQRDDYEFRDCGTIDLTKVICASTSKTCGSMDIYLTGIYYGQRPEAPGWLTNYYYKTKKLNEKAWEHKEDLVYCKERRFKHSYKPIERPTTPYCGPICDVSACAKYVTSNSSTVTGPQKVGQCIEVSSCLEDVKYCSSVVTPAGPLVGERYEECLATSTCTANARSTLNGFLADGQPYKVTNYPDGLIKQYCKLLPGDSTTTMTDSDALMACLDSLKCVPEASGDLGDGTPSKLDYRSPKAFYAGGTVSPSVTRDVVAKATDPGAKAVPISDTAIAGVDYGGYTPLYKEIDMVLNAPEIRSDMDAGKKVAFIVMTDGVSTDDGSTNVKSLCGSQSFLDNIARNPNAKALFVSLDDASDGNIDCATKRPDNYVSHKGLYLAEKKIKEFIGGDSAFVEDQAEATKFCIDYFGQGSIYTDNSVTSGNGVDGLNVCKPFQKE